MRLRGYRGGAASPSEGPDPQLVEPSEGVRIAGEAMRRGQTIRDIHRAAYRPRTILRALAEDMQEFEAAVLDMASVVWPADPQGQVAEWLMAEISVPGLDKVPEEMQEQVINDLKAMLPK